MDQFLPSCESLQILAVLLSSLPLAACLYESQITALWPVFDAGSTLLPGELPTLTTDTNPEVPPSSDVGSYRIRLVFQTCLPLPFLASVVADFF